MFFGVLILVMSAAVAHADPRFELAASQARAGDAVSFTITGADGQVRYEIEVNDRDVVEGAGSGAAVSGAFTMPDLGSSAKSVTVEADLDDEDGDTTVKRKLQYLGRALPPAAPDPPAAAPAAPATAAPATPAPAIPASPASPSAAPTPAAKRRTQRKRSKHVRKRGKARRNRTTARRGDRRESKPVRSKTQTFKRRTRRSEARTAPLFEGVPEKDSGGASVGNTDVLAAPAEKPPAAVATNSVANRSVDDGSAIATIVPGVLGMAAMSLAAATLLRRRRNR